MPRGLIEFGLERFVKLRRQELKAHGARAVDNLVRHPGDDISSKLRQQR
jgi:hypothetical protein